MPTQLQFRRGSAAQVSAFTGANSEIIVDSTNNLLTLHDGVTAGGYYMVGANQPQTLTNKTLASPVLSGNTTISGNLLPSTSQLYNLGSPTQRFGTLYLSANTIDLGGTPISFAGGNISLNGVNTGSVFSSNIINTANISTGNLTISGSTSTGNLTISGSTSTGNLSVTGYVNSNLTVNANVSASGTITSTGNLQTANILATGSTTTSTVYVQGGVFWAGNGLNIVSGSTGAFGTLQYAYYNGAFGAANIVFNPNNGNVVVTGTTTSTSTTTGALVVNGGVGVAGNLTVGGTLSVTGVSSALSFGTRLTGGSGSYTVGFAGGTGDIVLNNGATDTPGVHFYYGNNTNWGIDSASNYLRFTANLDESNGSVKCFMDTTGTFYATGDVIAAYSDDRLKDRIGTITNALDSVNSLTGFRYTPNQTALDLGVEDNRVRLGLSAQDVEAVYPELIELSPMDLHFMEGGITSKTGNNYKTIDYTKLVPVLVEAIKELSTQVTALQSELAAIKNNGQ